MLARATDVRLQEAAVTLRCHLSYSRLQTVDSRVWALNQITLLDLGHNDLKSLPAEVGQLLSLRELWINHNPNITTLPSELVACKELVQLDARSTGLCKVCWCRYFCASYATLVEA